MVLMATGPDPYRGRYPHLLRSLTRRARIGNRQPIFGLLEYGKPDIQITSKSERA